MTPFRIHAAFGLALLTAGVLFDFGYLAPKLGKAFQSDPVFLLHSFSWNLHNFTKSYMFVLGLANIAMSLIGFHFARKPRLDWAVLLSMVVGTVLFIGAGFWYASAGPAVEWELRCTFLTVGILGVLVSLLLETIKVMSSKTE